MEFHWNSRRRLAAKANKRRGGAPHHAQTLTMAKTIKGSGKQRHVKPKHGRVAKPAAKSKRRLQLAAPASRRAKGKGKAAAGARPGT
jgi:hypothetical protein